MTAFEEMLKEALDNGATEEEYEPDDGDYTTIVRATSTEITGQGKELAKLRLKILDGDDAGRVFDHTLFFSTQFATEKAVRTLAAYGVDFAGVTDLDSIGEAMEKVRGATAEVRVSHENGFVRIVVVGCEPPKSAPVAADNGADPDDDNEPPF